MCRWKTPTPGLLLTKTRGDFWPVFLMVPSWTRPSAALFENLVISELLKRRYNQGLASNLYFWRNNTGEEVDVVVEHGDKLMPIEIKSGQTFNSDFLSGLNKWARYAGDAALPAQLVYGGAASMTRNGVTVHGWREMSKLTG